MACVFIVAQPVHWAARIEWCILLQVTATCFPKLQGHCEGRAVLAACWFRCVCLVGSLPEPDKLLAG